MYKNLIKIFGILIIGALGAFIFNVSLMPYFLASAYFNNFQFVKDYKEGKIMVNKTEQVYIQQDTAVQDAIDRAQNSMVAIQGPGPKAFSSGLIATSDGSIITLASAVPKNGKATVFFQEEQMFAVAVKVDYKNNLALLKIDKNNLQTVGFANMDKVKLGQKVFLAAATGPGLGDWLANEGMVTQITQDAIKTNMLEKPLASSSPLFNTAGELVGLNVVGADGGVWAIPINKIQELLGL